MPVSANTVWEIRQAGADTNGGGFVTGASGTDFSQQNTVQFNLTGVTSAGAGDVVLTASAAASMVGNIAQAISGTNVHTAGGFYEVLSVVAGVSITFSTNAAGNSICGGAVANGVINIGGALKTLNKLGQSLDGSFPSHWTVDAGHIVYLKGSFTALATDQVDFAGTNTAPVRIIGYNATRGDGYLGRSGSPANGPLITTNFASLTYNASAFLKAGVRGGFRIWENISVISAVDGDAFQVYQKDVLYGCKSVNSSTGSVAAAFGSNQSFAAYYNCDGFLTGLSGGDFRGAFWFQFSNTAMVGCIARATSAASCGIYNDNQGCHVIGCLINNCGGKGIFQDDQNAVYMNCVITGNAGDGVKVGIGGDGTSGQFINCLITDNGGFGINLDDGDDTDSLMLINCDMHNNGSGNFSGGSAWAASAFNLITYGSANSDYVNSGSGNYNLKFASPANRAGIPLPANIGAYQTNTPPVGGLIF